MTDTTVHLTYAGNIYDRTAALVSGAVRPAGITLNYLGMSSPEVFCRMLRFEEFDASELSCANYFVLRSRSDTRYIAIPIFPSRTFRHSAVYSNTRAGIREPKDLRGKRVGCPEYAMTMETRAVASALRAHETWRGSGRLGFDSIAAHCAASARPHAGLAAARDSGDRAGRGRRIWSQESLLFKKNSWCHSWRDVWDGRCAGLKIAAKTC